MILFFVVNFFSRVGPPTLPELTTRYRQIKSGLSNATLKCHANGLDYNKLHFYHWQWRFQGRVIRKSDKYSMSDSILSPNFCHHSKGSTILRITNTSKEDLVQYVCVLLLSNISLAAKDISMGECSCMKRCGTDQRSSETSLDVLKVRSYSNLFWSSELFPHIFKSSSISLL